MLVKWAFCKQFSPLRYRTLISLEKGKFVFQKSLSETPFKPDQVSFCTPNFLLMEETNICEGLGGPVMSVPNENPLDGRVLWATDPRDPDILKTVRVVNLLSVVNLLRVVIYY